MCGNRMYGSRLSGADIAGLIYIYWVLDMLTVVDAGAYGEERVECG